MIPRAANVTEVRQYRQGSAVRETVVTPVLEKNTRNAKVRDDISATLRHHDIFGFQGADERTPLQAEREFLIVETEFPLTEEEIETFNPVSDVNEDRITLLARKYANKHMLPEDSARLNILTQRLRNTLPGITERDLEIMEGLNKQLESANRLNDRLQEKYK